MERIETLPDCLKESITLRFNRLAELRPCNIGLVFRDKHLTYSDLNKKSSQLANYILQSYSPAKGDVIGILSDPSEWTVISMLAILKLGCTYLPLDTRYPESRIQYMIEDSNANVLLIEEHLTCILSGIENKPGMVMLNDIEEVLTGFSHLFIDIETSPEDIAYIMYTSGTTGKPNGVEIPQKGILRLVCDTDYFDFNSKQIFLQLAPIGFDASTFEIWGALLNGQKLILYPEKLPDFIVLKNTIDEHKISVLWLTASLLNLIIDECPEILNNVRYILTGGEALSVNHIRKAQLLLPDTQFINGYGPTESTTFACCYKIPDITNKNINSVPIGKAIANTEVYLLDENYRLTESGSTGELYIGGYGLAKGYRNNPELTGKKFLMLSIPGEGVKRLYKTGDLCRKLADDTIEFVQRVDHQVKIRGFRIELSEIESAILKNENIAASLVIVKEHQIIAYITAPVSTQSMQSGCEIIETINTRQIKEELATWLPEYMIPHQIIELNHFPVNANGKVDRDNLPDRQTAQPATQTKQREDDSYVTQCWKELLQTETTEPDVHFFDLGGTSLHATQLIFRINKRHKCNISLKDFYNNPTISYLDERIKQQHNTVTVSEKESIIPGKKYPLTPWQEGILFCSEYNHDSPVYNIPMTVSMKGNLNVAALEEALNLIIGRHSILRTTYLWEDGTPYQQINNTEKIKLSASHLSTQRELEEELKQNISVPFNPGIAPVRFCLYKLAEDEHLLFMDIHHIAFDGWSLGILKKELSVFYNSILAGEKPTAETSGFQYIDFSNWYIKNKKDYGNELKYWKTKIGDNFTGTELKTDYPRPRLQTYKGKHIDVEINEGLLHELNCYSKEHSNSLFTTLISCFKIMLHKWTGERDIIIATPTLNRNQHEFEDTMGVFVNNIILSSTINSDSSFNKITSTVNDTIKEAFLHQEVPFMDLVKELATNRDPSRNPLYQILFVLENAEDQPIIMSGIDASFDLLSSDTAKCDLTFIAQEYDNRLKLRCEYNSDLYKKETIESLLNQLVSTVEFCIHFPLLPIDKLGDISNQENRDSSLIHDKCEAHTHTPIDADTTNRLIRIWKETLNLNHLNITDSFFDLGGYSLLAIKLIHRINKEFSVKLSLKTIFEYPSIALIGDVILNKTMSDQIENIVQIRKGKGDPVFLITGIIGNAFSFQKFSDNFRADQPLYVLEYPQDPEKTLSEISLYSLSSYFIDLIKQIYPMGSYHLLGYSLGGRVVYEMAIQLQRMGDQVGFLGIIDTEGFKSRFHTHSLKDRIFCEFEIFFRLNFAYKLKYLKKRVPFLLTDHVVVVDERSHFTDKTHKKLWTIWNSYLPTSQYKGELYLYNTDYKMSPENFKLHYYVKVFPDMCWSNHIKGKIHISTFDCKHAEFLEEPHVKKLAYAVSDYFNHPLELLKRSLPRFETIRNCANSDILSGQVEILFINYEKFSEDTQYLKSLLSESEIEKSLRFKSKEDRQSYIIRHGLLRTILSNILRLSPNELRLLEDKNDKNIIDPSQNSLKLDYSISSSKGHCIIAVARNITIGVDIEHIDLNFDHLEIAQNYYHPVESEQLTNMPANESQRLFFEIWTAKEAFIKANGIVELDQVRIPVFNSKETTAFNDWHLLKLDLTESFAGSLVSSQSDITVVQHRI